MPPRSGGIPVLYQTLGAATTAILCTGTVALFQDQFARGATLSGLNPDGGGPGFILLLIAGVVAYFTRPSSQSVLSIAGHTLIGLVYGLTPAGCSCSRCHFSDCPVKPACRNSCPAWSWLRWCRV